MNHSPTKIFPNCLVWQDETMANNSIVITFDDKLIIIDPSFNLTRILQHFENSKLPIIVILTHAHYDHVGELFDYLDKISAIYVSHEMKILFDTNYCNNLFFGKNVQLDKIDITKLKYINDGFKLDNFSFILTPGHSIDSLCLFSNKVIITGDLLFADSIGRSDLPYSENSEIIKSIVRIKKVLETHPHAVVIPGHGDYCIAEDVLKHNPFLN